MSDTTQLIYGGDMMLFVGSGATKNPLAFSTSAKLAISTSMKDATSKDSGIYTEKFAGRLDWNCSTDGLMSYTISGATQSIDDIYALMLSRTPINVVFASKTGSVPAWTVDASKKTFTGMGFIASMDMNAALDEATYSIKIDGSGPLTLA